MQYVCRRREFPVVYKQKILILKVQYDAGYNAHILK